MRQRIFVALVLCAALAYCQQQHAQSVVNIRIDVSRSVPAVNYLTNSSTHIDFAGTPLLPFASGTAKVKYKTGLIAVDAHFSNLSPAGQFGPEFLTYVLWAITPEGRAYNLGEVPLKGDKGHLKVTTRLPNFALIVTAEPYFAVSLPSEVVVLENRPREDTTGAVTLITATLLRRNSYDEDGLETFNLDPKVPLAVYEARNALRIALAEDAPRYAPDAWVKAGKTTAQMEDYLARKQRDPTITAARDATQQAEDARSVTLREMAKEKIEAKKQAADEQLALEQRNAAQREAELSSEREAAREQSARTLALAQQEEQARTEAEAAQKRTQLEAEQSALAATRAQREQQRLRAQLRTQLNSILETIDSPRGLVATMAEIQFAPGRYNLSPAERLSLAKLSGVIAEHPGLKLEIDGYTDNAGGTTSNIALSSQRADAVRTFLIDQGLRPDDITSVGMGAANPVADNETAEGRQQNRRVEIIVSGEEIGTKLGE